MLHPWLKVGLVQDGEEAVVWIPRLVEQEPEHHLSWEKVVAFCQRPEGYWGMVLWAQCLVRPHLARWAERRQD